MTEDELYNMEMRRIAREKATEEIETLRAQNKRLVDGLRRTYEAMECHDVRGADIANAEALLKEIEKRGA